MKRYLRCKDENCPHENEAIAKDWIRDNMPISKTGFNASDLDLIIWNNISRKFCILEFKTNMGSMKPFQYTFFGRLNKWIKEGIKSDEENWNYLDFNLITFEKYSFDDGKALLNGEPITAEEFYDKFNLL